jgi:all-trans-retinol dehydrogenase (NAD+)
MWPCSDCLWCCITGHPILSFLAFVFLLRTILGLLQRPKSLKDDVVFISGAASGIGRQMALRFAQLGCKVVVADINTDGAAQVAKEILAAKGQAMSLFCDVTSVDSVAKAAKQVRDKFGDPTILVNNAGIVSGKFITELSYENIERTFKVNAISHFYTIKELLPSMLANNKGHIVTIASMAGHSGVSKMTDYSGSKFAAVGLDESLRRELRALRSNVKTTCVCPYYINTGMFSGVSSGLLFPMMSEQWVAERIVKAVRYNEAVILLPNSMYLGTLLKGILPVGVRDWAEDLLGFQNSMDTFKGRG